MVSEYAFPMHQNHLSHRSPKKYSTSYWICLFFFRFPRNGNDNNEIFYSIFNFNMKRYTDCTGCGRWQQWKQIISRYILFSWFCFIFIFVLPQFSLFNDERREMHTTLVFHCVRAWYIYFLHIKFLFGSIWIVWCGISTLVNKAVRGKNLWRFL